jgi:DoxX-like family
MKIDKVIYWVSTAIFCCIMLFSASMYFLKYEMIKGFFESMHYPTYIVYPLAMAKIMGVIAILTQKSTLLKEWAYAGFFFDALLATAAHLHAKDGGHLMAMSAMVMLIISRIYETNRFKK